MIRVLRNSAEHNSQTTGELSIPQHPNFLPCTVGPTRHPGIRDICDGLDIEVRNKQSILNQPKLISDLPPIFNHHKSSVPSTLLAIPLQGLGHFETDPNPERVNSSFPCRRSGGQCRTTPPPNRDYLIPDALSYS